jgi:hypothetical protein
MACGINALPVLASVLLFSVGTMKGDEMRKLSMTGLAVLVLCLGLVGPGEAVPITYFGEDLTPGGTVPAGGNSETARTNFLAGLVGVGNEDFESFAAGTLAPLALAFPGSSGSITATLNGGGSVINGPGGGRFPTSGDQWWNNDPGEQPFVIGFSAPIAAFGFYATDIGDFGGNITLELTNGGTVDLVVPNTVGAPNGALLFYGFIDPTTTYTQITFGNTSTADGFGFDDMVVGDLQQVVVPEPATLVLLGSGLVAVGLRRRR